MLRVVHYMDIYLKIILYWAMIYLKIIQKNVLFRIKHYRNISMIEKLKLYLVVFKSNVYIFNKFINIYFFILFFIKK